MPGTSPRSMPQAPPASPSDRTTASAASSPGYARTPPRPRATAPAPADSSSASVSGGVSLVQVRRRRHSRNMYADHPVRMRVPKPRRNARAPVPAMRSELVVPKHVHQVHPEVPYPRHAPPALGRSARKAVARHRRRDHVERVRRIAAMRPGSASNGMILYISKNVLGHPCVITSGIGFGPRPRSWM